MSKIDLRLGDCLDVLKTLDDNSVDSIVTDPPYGLSFMGKAWDKSVPSVEVWQECLRVLKPGGHLLSFAGTRTQHKMAVAIEDAGFEIRDMIAWMYGSSFPKHKNALKPAFEPITLARKPLNKGDSVARNAAKYGTGEINTDECLIDYNGEIPKIGGRAKHGRGDGYGFKPQGEQIEANKKGRWPANIIHDGSDEVVELFPVDKIGSKSRFFYCAKASKKDRNEGLESPNTHPTVKPSKLMRYLCRLVTPPNGTVLDPFMGSGSTGKGAVLEGFDFIGIELDEDYLTIAKSRIEYAMNNPEESEDKSFKSKKKEKTPVAEDTLEEFL